MLARSLIVFLSFLFASNGFCAQPKARNSITKEIEVDVFVYAAMASNVYKDRENIFPLSKIGWEKLSFDGSVIMSNDAHTYTREPGLAFDVWRKAGTNDVVIAFRGSDSKYDHIASNLTPFS